MAAPMTFRKCSSCISVARQFIEARCQLRNMRIVCMSSEASVSGTTANVDKDPFPLYASNEVQSILRRITGFDLMKVAGPKQAPLERPVYKLLTDDELAQEQDSARQQLSKYLNPPPYMNPRQPVKEPLVVDPDLAHFDTSCYVFSDISFGVKDRDRSVVVREVDGTLRVAPWDVRDRMNHIYNPEEGRAIIKPQLFQEVHMERLISEEKFVYILKRACAQFEPDDPDFLRVCHRVYSAVNASRQFDVLRSTRFFAPMAFHLVWTKMVDSLLADMLNRDLESDIVDLVNLYCVVHPNGEFAQVLKGVDGTSAESAVKVFLDTEARVSMDVELALQGLLDRKNTKQPDSDSVTS